MAFGITAFAESPFSATGSTSVNVAVTGQELTIAETSPGVVIDVTVSLTGQAMTAALASVTAIADVDVSTTGQELTMQEGQADATDSIARLTGIAMTMTQGTVKNVIWTEVNTGSTPTWTEIDTAA